MYAPAAGSGGNVEGLYAPVGAYNPSTFPLKRHVEALHDLTHEEFRELADFQYRLAQVMQSRVSIEKEYMMCFAEVKHFKRVHIHFVAKPQDLPQEAKGPCIFSYLNVDQQSAVPPDEIKVLCEELKEALIQQF